MMMSTRTKEIIQIVTAEKGYITIKDIAGKMGISERTVYREIPEITDVLSEYDITLETVSKKGIRIVGGKDKIRKLTDELNAVTHIQIVDPKERMNFIILSLLHEEEFIKTEALAIDLETSLPTVRNDLKKIGKIVSEYGIRLVQKKGEGICLSGSQVAKDHLMTNILVENIEIQNFLQCMEGDGDKSHPFISKLWEYGYKESLQKCYHAFSHFAEEIEEETIYLEDRSYLEFILFAAFMVCRHESGQTEEKMDFLLKKADETEQNLAKEASRIIEEKFEITLTEEEHAYVLWMVHICIAPGFRKKDLEKNLALRPKIAEFVENVEEQMGIYLGQDEKLMDGLLTHMDKALKRIRSGMSISNPIIREIEKDYKQLFAIIRESVRKVFPEDYFPDDEIGYLVLYFAVSLDNITKKTFRILVVCSSGMGSSKMLASRLEREIPEIYVRKIVSLIGLGKEDLNEYDLILSTVPLYLDDEMYLKVSPLLNKQELELVKEKIRRHKHKTLRRIEEREKNSKRWESMDGLAAMKELNQFTEYSMQLLKDFKVLHLNPDSDQVDVYKSMGDWAEEIGLQISQSELLEYKQGKKAKECYFVIPSTGVSYFECFLESIQKPALVVCYFNGQKITDWQGDDELSAMIALFYPKKLTSLEREFIGSITDVIIEDANIIQMIEQGKEEDIKGYLCFRFLEYIREII